MYMMTKGKSNIPLIKLSEGYSVGRDKSFFVTIVSGSNGEALKPVRVWGKDDPFLFFDKEKLNAEFISKTELVYIKATHNKLEGRVIIEVTKYKIPDFMQNNMELEYDALRKTKPITEQLLNIMLPYDDIINNTIDLSFLSMLCDGKFNDAICTVLGKLKEPCNLCYSIGGAKIGK